MVPVYQSSGEGKASIEMYIKILSRTRQEIDVLVNAGYMLNNRMVHTIWSIQEAAKNINASDTASALALLTTAQTGLSRRNEHGGRPPDRMQ